VGASPDTTRGGGFIWWRICENGYLGEKYPVSRSSKELNGIPCYPSVAEIDKPVDVVVVAIPAAGVEGVVADCVRKGVRFAVIHAAGFAELGEEGKERQEGVVRTARSGGMRVVGPNCMGLFSPEVRLNTIVEVDPADLEPGRVAFCGQSGWATENFVAGGTARGLKFSTAISTGNQADLDLTDYIAYFGNDPKTSVICAYAEGIKRGKDFLQLVSRVGSAKPVVIWKSGFSQAGARAAVSHSGSIAGDRDVWLGAAGSAGIVPAEGFEELVDMAVAFSAPSLPKGKRVGIMVEAGGGGISASDACERLGLEVRPFSSDLRKELRGFLEKLLPPFSGISNPLDLVWLPRDKAMSICTTCMELMAGEVDAVITMSYLPFMDADFRKDYIEALCRIRDRLHLPVFMVPPYASRAAVGMKDFSVAGLPAFPSFERAAKAVAATAGYAERVSS
jgi:acyl-CoA synthetase (NDP forming)